MSSNEIAPEDQKIGGNYENTKEALNKIDKVITSTQLALANPILLTVPGPVVVGVSIAKLEDAKSKNDGAIRDVAEYIAWSGRPDKLRAAADKWSDIQLNVSRCAGLFTADSMRADDRWESLAADAYLSNFDPQKAALSAVAEKAGTMSAQLTALAEAIRTFWARVAAKTTKLVDDLVSSITDPTNMPGLIFGTVTRVAQYMGEIWQEVKDAGKEFQKSTSDILSIKNDQTAFPLGKWKGPSGDFYDGDWKPSR